ncbi:UNVERIFIED_ORG: hypothetical protein B2H93_14440 [Clostridium botulinum]
MLKINGVAIAAPKTFQASINDIDAESNRNANGELIRDRIATKRKIELEWGPLDDAECSTILKAVKNVFFEVEFPDPIEGKFMIKTMYVGDRTAPMYVFSDGKPKWSCLKMNFIEK